jgi:acyl-CoA thioesterase FadM
MAAKCKRATEIVNVASKVVVARAITTWGYVEIASGRPVRIPQSVRDAFGMRSSSTADGG